jgi:hypothetical protein
MNKDLGRRLRRLVCWGSSLGLISIPVGWARGRVEPPVARTRLSQAAAGRALPGTSGRLQAGLSAGLVWQSTLVAHHRSANLELGVAGDLRQLALPSPHRPPKRSWQLGDLHLLHAVRRRRLILGSFVGRFAEGLTLGFGLHRGRQLTGGGASRRLGNPTRLPGLLWGAGVQLQSGAADGLRLSSFVGWDLHPATKRLIAGGELRVEPIAGQQLSLLGHTSLAQRGPPGLMEQVDPSGQAGPPGLGIPLGQAGPPGPHGPFGQVSTPPAALGVGLRLGGRVWHLQGEHTWNEAGSSASLFYLQLGRRGGMRASLRGRRADLRFTNPYGRRQSNRWEVGLRVGRGPPGARRRLARADTWADARSDASAGVRINSPADARADLSADVRANASADVRINSPTDARADLSADVRANAPSNARISSSADVPANTAADERADTPAAAPANRRPTIGRSWTGHLQLRARRPQARRAAWRLEAGPEITAQWLPGLWVTADAGWVQRRTERRPAAQHAVFGQLRWVGRRSSYVAVHGGMRAEAGLGGAAARPAMIWRAFGSLRLGPVEGPRCTLSGSWSQAARRLLVQFEPPSRPLGGGLRVGLQARRDSWEPILQVWLQGRLGP